MTKAEGQGEGEGKGRREGEGRGTGEGKGKPEAVNLERAEPITTAARRRDSFKDEGAGDERRADEHVDPR